MSNHENFKATMEQVELSQFALQKMKDVEGKRMKKPTWKYVVTAASLALFFLLSNTICYAMTGNSFIDQVRLFLDIEKEHIMINNGTFSESLTNTYVGEDGLTYYEFSDGSITGISVRDPAHTSIFDYKIPIEGGFVSGIIEFVGTLYEEDGSIYLDLYGDPIDVTEDFVDGVITGSFIYTGLENEMSESFEYRVEGTLKDYTVDVWWIESK